jgi:hypothetical protein
MIVIVHGQIPSGGKVVPVGRSLEHAFASVQRGNLTLHLRLVLHPAAMPDSDQTQIGPCGGTMLGTILLIVLILLLLGAIPAWPYSRGWGYYPSGGLGLVLIVIVILLATGRI